MFIHRCILSLFQCVASLVNTTLGSSSGFKVSASAAFTFTFPFLLRRIEIYARPLCTAEDHEYSALSTASINNFVGRDSMARLLRHPITIFLDLFTHRVLRNGWRRRVVKFCILECLALLGTRCTEARIACGVAKSEIYHIVSARYLPTFSNVSTAEDRIVSSAGRNSQHSI